MLHLRTVLLWLAFVLLISLEFVYISNFSVAMTLRLGPTFILLLWILSYFFYTRKYTFGKDVGKGKVRLINFVRVLANIFIVSGAIARIMHYKGAQLLLISGIGLLALWSTFFSVLAVEKKTYDPDIIDSEESNPEEDDNNVS